MSEKITFKELVEKISEATEQSEQSINSFIHALVGIIESGLEKGEKITISGFGKFELRWMNERSGINPQTGEQITIPGHNKVVFKPYKALREHINLLFKNLNTQVLDESPGKTRSAGVPKSKKAADTEQRFSSGNDKKINTNSDTSDDDVEELLIERPSPLAGKIHLTKYKSDAAEDSSGTHPYHVPAVAGNTRLNTTENILQLEGKYKESQFRWTYIVVAAIILLVFISFMFTQYWPGDTFDQSNITTVDQIELQQGQSSPSPSLSPATMPNEPGEPVSASEEPNVTEHTITAGESLWTIAEHKYKNPFLWPIIFYENRNVLENPNLIPAGGSLKVPILSDPDNLTKSESESVARGYLNVYDWMTVNQPVNARYFLWAVGSFSQDELQRVSERVDETDLAFANQR